MGGLRGGLIGKAYAAALAEMLDDLDDRPTAGKRQVIFTLVLEPVTTDAGVLTDVEVTTELKTRKPPTHTGTVRMAPVSKASGGLDLRYQEYAPDDPKQHTLDEEANRAASRKDTNDDAK